MTSLVNYHKEYKFYPATEDYSNFLVYQPDPTYKTELPIEDPWGSPYIYESPGPKDLPYRISSLGADKAVGGIGKNSDLFSDDVLKELLESLEKKKSEKRR